MDILKAREILEALASGYSPVTGESLDNESILNERDVIRALQIAIDHLNNQKNYSEKDIAIDNTDIEKVINLLTEQDKRVNSSNLIGFFLGTKKFKSPAIISNSLYGKFGNTYTKGQLLDFFNEYLISNNLINNLAYNYYTQSPYYKEFDFFRIEKFNKLSDNAINQLKEKINDLGIVKTEDLSEVIKTARITHPRAYEPWSEKEIELLNKAMKYTNDLKLLSECFQRGKGSIESGGLRLLKKLKTEGEKNS